MNSRIVPAPPKSPEPTLRHALRFVSRNFHALLQQRLHKYGVSEAEYIVLFTLKRVPDLSSADISRWTGVSPQGGNQILKALLERGLVERTPSPHHGRILRSNLTAEGRRIIQACEREADDLERVMCSDMSQAESEQLVELLHRAAAGLGRPIGSVD